MTGKRSDWQSAADQYAAEAMEAGAPTAWFERLWAGGSAGELTMPWDRDDPHPVLAAWTADRAHRSGLAIVVGCGLGADAEHLAGLGYDTTAFDLSPTAVATAQQRHPGSPVNYECADLVSLPQEWLGRFDLVVEIYTVQAVPLTLRETMTDAVVSLVAPGGTLLAIQGIRPADDDGSGPPWPLTREEMEAFARHDLTVVDLVETDGGTGRPRWRAELQRA